MNVNVRRYIMVAAAGLVAVPLLVIFAACDGQGHTRSAVVYEPGASASLARRGMKPAMRARNRFQPRIETLGDRDG